MEIKDCYIGKFVKVKDDIWNDWCLRSQSDQYGIPHKPQPIISKPSYCALHGYVMLAFPVWWWLPDELEEELEEG